MSLLNKSAPYSNDDAILLYILLYDAFHSPGVSVPKAYGSNRGFRNASTTTKHFASRLTQPRNAPAETQTVRKSSPFL